LLEGLAALLEGRHRRGRKLPHQLALALGRPAELAGQLLNPPGDGLERVDRKPPVRLFLQGQRAFQAKPGKDGLVPATSAQRGRKPVKEASPAGLLLPAARQRLFHRVEGFGHALEIYVGLGQQAIPHLEEELDELL